MSRCAADLVASNPQSPEGYFLAGLAEKAGGHPARAAEHFARALELDAARYDAAIELASRYSVTGRHPEAFDLLQRYEPHLDSSPRYLDLAGFTYATIGLHERAWPLYRRANELQPGVPRFMAHLAASAVYLGKFGEAKALYRALLDREPAHQRNHYQLAQLERAGDTTHVEQMKAVLRTTQLPPARNIFLYYAIGKELEDLGQWDEAFEYYRMAGDAVTSIADYDAAVDVALIDTIIATCTPAWLAQGAPAAVASGKTPIFIVGLPRTGTTLTERILASHSQVESIGETLQLPAALRRISGVETPDAMNAAIVAAAATRDLRPLADVYMGGIRHRLGDRPMFIEKYPENFLLLGFIARAWPDARLVYLRRNPMDSCFAMYKQSYFKAAYTLENLGRYYVAHDRLLRHWRATLGARLIEVRYESLVTDQEGETRALLARLGLPFEPACLEFEKNVTSSATASAVQVREKMHARSVNRWKRFERQLQPLRRILEDAGIAIE
ncbi:MAG TPA: tetratricopeptide repeat protein [Steroidobacteraceae bacterium]|nr:tetratricopeptide repeat protein [Steroidobacteraceae bacterium]